MAVPSTMRRRGGTAVLRREARTAWFMSSPALLPLLPFMGIPILLTFILSLMNTRLISPNPPQSIGMENFVRAFADDPTFIRSLVNTVLFALAVVSFQSILTLALAVLVSQKVKGVTALRAMILMPVVASMAVVSTLWNFFYRDNDLFNSMLSIVTGGR